MKDTLSTLDLSEQPGQRITWFRQVRHFQIDQPVYLRPDETVFSCGPHHEYYSYAVESENRPND